MVSAPSLRPSPCVTSSLVASQSGGMSDCLATCRNFGLLKNVFGLVGINCLVPLVYFLGYFMKAIPLFSYHTHTFLSYIYIYRGSIACLFFIQVSRNMGIHCHYQLFACMRGNSVSL